MSNNFCLSKRFTAFQSFVWLLNQMINNNIVCKTQINMSFVTDLMVCEVRRTNTKLQITVKFLSSLR